MARGPLKIVLTVVILMAAWVMLTLRTDLDGLVQELIAGGLIAIAVGIFLSGILPEAGGANPIVRLLKFPIYLLVLFKEMVKANLDVAYRVLHPKMPIKPGIVEVRPGIESEMGKLVLANSITLTPGTLSMDYIDDKLYIHWINVKDDPAESMKPLDKTVKEVFP
ncbi:MAG: Na+/H+ antiporter subunit E [Thermoplasmatota archaeon]